MASTMGLRSWRLGIANLGWLLAATGCLGDPTPTQRNAPWSAGAAAGAGGESRTLVGDAGAPDGGIATLVGDAGAPNGGIATLVGAAGQTGESIGDGEIAGPTTGGPRSGVAASMGGEDPPPGSTMDPPPGPTDDPPASTGSVSDGAGAAVTKGPDFTVPLDPGAGGSASSPAPSAGFLTAGAWDDNRNFAWFLKYWTGLTQASTAGLLPYTNDELEAAHASWSPLQPAHRTLDIALVIDTTGSMGDELTYLQQEFLALYDSIQARFPDAQQRWSLVLYRDTTDQYVVRWYNFRTLPEDYKNKLAIQVSSGGGDEPEAVDQALQVASQLDWRADADTARLAFWVADAPQHAEKSSLAKQAVEALRTRGVHVYPVAASGASNLAEAAMRVTALVTGGRYVFLTDDSGVGGSHEIPKIPCYFVTLLDRAILRMVDIEMTGRYVEPTAGDVLRTGGDPRAGACQLSTGEILSVF